ncbi:TPA: conjugal transfer protein TraD [Morganella morganii]|uniref:conjugal transfer protein TraD n=1 Tax=Morganella morganii TaxID=582 RepID=UPI0030CA159A
MRILFNLLKSKWKFLSKSVETRLKITLCAELAKTVDCKVDDIDKEFILRVLLNFQNIISENKAKFQMREKNHTDIIGR